MRRTGNRADPVHLNEPFTNRKPLRAPQVRGLDCFGQIGPVASEGRSDQSGIHTGGASSVAQADPQTWVRRISAIESAPLMRS